MPFKFPRRYEGVVALPRLILVVSQMYSQNVRPDKPDVGLKIGLCVYLVNIYPLAHASELRISKEKS